MSVKRVVQPTEQDYEEQVRRRLIQGEKLVTFGLLAAGVAHELNNILTSILGNTELALYNSRNNKLEAMHDLVAIEMQTWRAIDTVRNLLNFMRQRSSQQRQTSINDIVTQSLELRAYYLQAHGITIDLQLGENIPLLFVDAFQLQHAVLNLIMNAEQAVSSPNWRMREPAPASARLMISTAYVQDAPEDLGMVIIRIADNGPGIQEDIMDRIFEPFFTTKPEGEGIGLGMAIVVDIVNYHQGQVRVTSQVDHGAVVEICLPMTYQPIDIEEQKNTMETTWPDLYALGCCD